MSIFISYSSKDERYAVKLEKALTVNGYETWFAPKSIGAGESFVTNISEELSKHNGTTEKDRIMEDKNKLRNDSACNRSHDEKIQTGLL